METKKLLSEHLSRRVDREKKSSKEIKSLSVRRLSLDGLTDQIERTPTINYAKLYIKGTNKDRDAKL